MPLSLRDFPTAANLAAGFYPAVETTDAVGASVELADTDGPYFAIQVVGELEDDTVVTGQIQQSADESSWSAITGGAFTAVTARDNVQAIQFTPTLRYVRWTATIAGGVSPSAAVAAIIGRQKKTF